MLKLNPSYLLRRFSNASFLQPTTNPQINNYINLHLDNFFSKKFLPLQTLSQSHAFIIVTGNHNNVFITSKLISLYASLSKPNLSTRVFDSIHCKKDPFLWNSIIKSHFSNGFYQKALYFFLGMRFSNCPPSDFTIPMVVTACAEIGVLGFGEMVHGLVVKFGVFGGNTAVGSSFVYLYSKCGCMGDAHHVFDEMPVRDVVAWTALVIGYLRNGEGRKCLECLCLMHGVGENGERPNDRTFEGGFQACGNLGLLAEGRCLQGLVIKNGYEFCQTVRLALLSMYSKCGTPEEAYRSFCEVGDKDLVCWTSVIAAYARLGCVTECLGLFWQMQEAGICSDEIVISCVLSSLSSSVWVSEAKALHGLVVRKRYDLYQAVQRALVSMYCNLGMLADAERVFARIEERDPETWNLMVFKYEKAGLARECMGLYREMLQQGVECDSNSLIAVISSCSQLGTISLGKSLHCYVLKCVHNENISISNSLIDMYGKCGSLTIGKRIFGGMQRDTVSWNTLISAYVSKGDSAEAVSLFDEMILEGFSPNSATLVGVLSACSRLACLEQGLKIHNYIKETGVELNMSLETALIDMYGKCGQLEKSRQIFNSMNERDVISWNVMISCYRMHGDARSAIEVFKQMEESNIRPNGLTFLAVLSACTYAGLAEEGRCFFHKMQDYSVTPSLKHYACIVDLLAKSSNLQEAEDLVLSMPMIPDGGIWGTLLSACKIHNEIEMGIRVAKQAIKADPENDGYYISVSNMLDSKGKWEEAEKFREVMKEKKVRKRLGWSTL